MTKIELDQSTRNHISEVRQRIAQLQQQLLQFHLASGKLQDEIQALTSHLGLTVTLLRGQLGINPEIPCQLSDDGACLLVEVPAPTEEGKQRANETMRRMAEDAREALGPALVDPLPSPPADIEEPTS